MSQTQSSSQAGRLLATISAATLLIAGRSTAHPLSFSSTVSYSPSQPSGGAASISNWTGATFDAANIGGSGVNADGGSDNGAANDASTYVANNQPRQGQVITTGSNPNGYDVASITVRMAGYTNNTATGNNRSGWNMNFTNGPIQIEIGKVTGTDCTTMSRQLFTAGSVGNPGSGQTATGAGTYITFNLPFSTHLEPNTTYGFDFWIGNGSSNYFEWLGTTTDAYAGGTAYTRAWWGGPITPLAGERVFMVNMTASAGAPVAFTHPGTLHTPADIDRMKTKVAANAQPWKADYDILTNSPWAQTWWPAYDVDYINRGGSAANNYTRSQQDAQAIYELALRWQITGDTAYADHAVQIANVWSGLLGVTGDSNKSLGTGICGYLFAIGGDLLSTYPGWPVAEKQAYKDMMMRVFYPENLDFLWRHHDTPFTKGGNTHYRLNWDTANIASMAAIGILCDNRAVYEQAVDFFKYGPSNGRIERAAWYVHPDGMGQTEEIGRDQGHNLGGWQAMALLCQTAWNQGDDLYGYDNNRVLRAFEMNAKYNLGNDVPWVFHRNCDLDYTETISGAERGNFVPMYEQIYNHYVNVKGIAAPYSKTVAEMMRPEPRPDVAIHPSQVDWLGLGSLTYTRDPIAAGVAPSGLFSNWSKNAVTLSWWGSAYATSYDIKRATVSGGPYTTVGSVGTMNTTFTDSNVANGTTYYYIVTAATPTGNLDSAPLTVSQSLVTQYTFENTFNDVVGTRHATAMGGSTGAAGFATGKNGQAASFDGVDDYVKLPVGSGNYQDITLSAWVYWNGGGNWQRVFDFGSEIEKYMMLTVKDGAGKLNFTMTTSRGTDGTLTLVGPAMPTATWTHVAVTLNGGTATMYVNGLPAASATADRVAPLFGQPFCYLGRSMWNSDPLFSGRIDDFRIHNYALSGSDIYTLWGQSANSPPVFASDPINKPSATEDASYTAQTLAGDASDANGGTLTFSKVSGPAWLAVAASGALSGTPANSDVGVNAFVVRVTDPSGATDDANLYITVANTNDAPVWTSTSITKPTVTRDQPYTGSTLAGLATDVDGGATLTFSKTNGPTWLTVSTDGTLSGTPAVGDVGANTFTVRVTDNAGATADATLFITVLAFELRSQYQFESNTNDSTGNFPGSATGSPVYATGRIGQGIVFDGIDDNVTLPADIVNHRDLTLAAYVYWNGGGNWQRLFDFGNSQTSYLMLTPNTGSGMRFTITNGGVEQQLNTTVLPIGQWVHIAVTLNGDTGTLYINGTAVATNTGLTLNPDDLKPALNYIGKSQFADPLFNGKIDDFRIYNYALGAVEIADMANPIPEIPNGLTAAGRNHRIDLTWKVSQAADTYTVKRSTVSGGPYTTIASGLTTTSFSNTGLTNGTPYYYVISATNEKGECANSAEIGASPSDLLVRLKFDETSGTTAADSSGNGYPGTAVNSPTWISGQFNNAINLANTSSQCVTMPSGVVTGVDDFTISTWVKMTSLGNWARLFDLGTGTTNYMFLAPQGPTANRIRFAIRTPSVNEQIINSTVNTPVGTWFHVAVTLAGTTGRLYINGVEAGSNTGMTLKPSSLGPTNLNYLGKSQFADPYLNGALDDFRIYGRAFSAAEITSLSTVLPAPTGLAATAGSGQVSLTWNTVSGASGYSVKRATTSGGPYTTVQTDVTGTTFTNTGLTNATVYYYVVSATNLGGESPNSGEASATPLAPPGIPTGLAATAGDSTVFLEWTASNGTDSYKVKRATSPGGPYTTIATGLTTTSRTDSTVSNGTVYYYVVSSVNTVAESDNSAEVSAIPLPPVPSQPTTLTATPGNATVSLAWSAAAGTNRYSVKRATNSGGPYTTIAGSLTTTAYSDTDVSNNTTYYYVVSAANLGGESEPSPEASATPVAPPITPAGLAATAGDASASLVWNSTAGASGYRVKRSTTNGGPYSIVAGNITSTTYSDTGLTNGTVYYYVVSAYNAGGDSADSSQVTAAPQAVPVAPTGLAATVVSSSKISLTWNTVTTASSYTVKRATSSGGPYTTVASGLTSTNLQDTALTSITTYYYVVSALSNGGESPVSAEASATTTDLRVRLAFDETTGTTAGDSSGDGYDANLVNGPLFSTGTVGNAVDLDGTNDHVTLPSAAINNLTTFTASVWVKPDTVSTWARVFDFGTGATANMFLTPKNGANGKVRFAITTSGGAGEQRIDGLNPLPAGTWSHVVITLSGNTGILYVNGSEVGRNTSMTLNPASLGTTTQNYIGRSQYPDPYFDGRVDDFRLYTRALGASEITAMTQAQMPLATVTGLQASAVSSGQINLTWTAGADATSYNVKRASTPGGPYTTVATGLTSSAYSNTGLTSGTTYYYVVSGSNAGGEGSNSTEASAATIPDAPASLTASTVSSARIDLAWGASTGATSYQVKRSATSGGPYTTLATGLSSTSYSDTGLDAGATWYYVVSASNSGTSADSTQASATTLADTPTDLVATVVSSSDINITWTASAGASSYDVKRSTSVSGPFVSISTGLTTSNFSDVGLNAATTYYYVVSAVNAAGASPNSAPANATTLPLPPAAPSGLTATAGNAQVSLTWSSVSGATSYSVKRSTISGGPYTNVASGVTAISYTDTGLSNGTTYFYVVSGSNTGGEGSNSTEASATTIPAAPATLTAATVSSVRIDLAWSASAGATTYQVKRSATNGGPYTTLATGLSSTSYSDTGLTAGATWYYVVSASNTGTSTDSTQASATTLAATPTGLAATAVSSSGINLTWTASAGAASYEVKRATSASGPFVSITTGLTISNFSDVGLTAATTYYYVVSAVNAGGSSPNSTSANATTLPVAPVAPSGLTATAGNTQVSLAWSSVSGAASYNVKRATVSGGPYTTVASSVTTTSYTNTGLTNGTTYYYVVNAVNTGGTSADSSQATATPTGLPSPWVTLDVGAVAAAGTANHNAGVYTIEGSGADIAGSADELRYVYQAASGDCNIIARVTSIENTSSTAKAGIVIRESTATGSRYAGVFLTPGGQARFQRRTSTDGSTTTNSTNSITVPRYIRLTRTGNNFDASYSSNGTTWIQFGGTRSITMSTAVTIGLGVSSNADGTLCTAVFDNVTATP